jgi:DNA-binding transcriptional ArsR family regulator
MEASIAKPSVIFDGFSEADNKNVKDASLVLRALNHKLRQQILKLMASKPGITVTELYVKLRLEQSVASQHLAILRRAGIVTTQREGKLIHYSIDPERVDQIGSLCKNLVKA